MTRQTRYRIGKWIDRAFRGLVLIGLVIAIFAVVRDIQTRGLVDKPAREVAVRTCRQENARWNAYLTTIAKVSNKRSPEESDAEYAARRQRSKKILASITDVVTFPCELQ